MSTQSLREFDSEVEEVNLDEHIHAISVYGDQLTDEQIARLRSILFGRGDDQVEYNASFNLREEVQAQIMAVRALRNSVMPGGRVSPGMHAREIKEMISASSTLLNTLLKTHGQILSLERSRCIEEAVTEAIKTLPDEARESFLSLLETNLSAIE